MGQEQFEKLLESFRNGFKESSESGQQLIYLSLQIGAVMGKEAWEKEEEKHEDNL